MDIPNYSTSCLSGHVGSIAVGDYARVITALPPYLRPRSLVLGTRRTWGLASLMGLGPGPVARVLAPWPQTQPMDQEPVPWPET